MYRLSKMTGCCNKQSDIYDFGELFVTDLCVVCLIAPLFIVLALPDKPLDCAIYSNRFGLLICTNKGKPTDC